MGALRKLFGPSKDEIWNQLSGQLGAEFVKGGFAKSAKVQVHVKEWTITLDTYTVHTQHSHTTYTRMRAPYVNVDQFHFTIYRKGIFTALGKILGMQDVEVGFPEFDNNFVIKGSDEMKLRELFVNPEIRRLIEAQPTIHLEVRDDEGWFGAHFPDGVDELRFQVRGVIKDVDRLKLLYDLFAETLNHLCHMGSAYESNPQVKL